ncbi:hypothetical protein [Halopseudomonas xiamenensis]|uniref:hypothetical protein n=1 Tax=Halopseudomonas xiamenensis TaxID=157792 RepID=UPI00162A544F|nr:hypothetical protein [Halopseudomonas xiamenensis]
MLKRILNDVTLVVFASAVLVTLTVNAVQRPSAAQSSQALSAYCPSLQCNAMNPGHWL